MISNTSDRMRRIHSQHFSNSEGSIVVYQIHALIENRFFFQTQSITSTYFKPVIPGKSLNCQGDKRNDVYRYQCSL
jgi:hypothetical protein